MSCWAEELDIQIRYAKANQMEDYAENEIIRENLTFLQRFNSQLSTPVMPDETELYSVSQSPLTGERVLAVKEGKLTIQDMKELLLISPSTTMGKFKSRAALAEVSFCLFSFSR
jgi:hypothetical protein